MMRVGRQTLRWWTALCLLGGLGEAQITETAKLVVPPTADDIQFQEYLAAAIAATDGQAWLGEWNDHGLLRGEGAIFGFERTADGWKLSENLQPKDPHYSEIFGYGLDWGDGFAVVGAPWDSSHLAREGSVRLLLEDQGEWVEHQKLLPPHGVRNYIFGERIAIDGNRVLISARGDDDGQGAAYVYRREGRELVLEQKLVPHWNRWSWAAASNTIALYGDVAVLGAGASGWGPPHTTFAGMVFVFEKVNGKWKQTAALFDPTPHNEDNFGLGLAVDDDVIAVGEPVPIGNMEYRVGSVFIFERQGSPPGNWVLTQELHASNAKLNNWGGDEYGMALDFHEGKLLVGAPFGRKGNLLLGTAYLLERDAGGAWVETKIFAPEADDAPYGGFGRAVSLCSSYALIGDPFAEGSVPGIRSGAAYVYELPLGEESCPGIVNSTGAAGDLWVTGSLAASSEAVELWAGDLPAGQVGLFMIGSAPGFVANPGGSQGNLCLGGLVGRFRGSLTGTGSAGEMHYVVDTTSLPLPPPATIQPGQTWYFQGWYRDQNPTPTSNFTSAVAVTFR